MLDLSFKIVRLTAAEYNTKGVELIRLTCGFEIAADAALVGYKKNTPVDFWGIYDNKCLIGMIGLGTELSAPFRIWLGYFGVDPTCQSAGVGSSLLNFVQQECKQRNYRWVFVETYDTPHFQPALNFYRNNGFKKVGYLKNYLINGASAIFLMKDLK